MNQCTTSKSCPHRKIQVSAMNNPGWGEEGVMEQNVGCHSCLLAPGTPGWGKSHRVRETAAVWSAQKSLESLPEPLKRVPGLNINNRTWRRPKEVQSTSRVAEVLGVAGSTRLPHRYLRATQAQATGHPLRTLSIVYTKRRWKYSLAIPFVAAWPK